VAEEREMGEKERREEMLTMVDERFLRERGTTSASSGGGAIESPRRTCSTGCAD
jgi:hypothetical protein